MKENKQLFSRNSYVFRVRKAVIAVLAVTNISTAVAQGIVSPDTVTVGTTVNFSVNNGTTKFMSYAWEFGNSSFKPIVANAVPIPNTGNTGDQFALAASACMVYNPDKNIYHAFVTCASNGFANPHIRRIDYGANPNNPSPATVNLGNPGNLFINNNGGFHNMEDIYIVQNNDGIFHAFINNGGIVHWTFGNGLDAAPTASSRMVNNPSVLGTSMNMAVLKYNNSWYLFTGQTFGVAPGMVRFDLGANLSTIPATIPYQIFQAPQGYNDLGYFALIKEGGQWYMNMTNHGSNSPLIRYNFGADLLNTNPVITNLGMTNPSINYNRGLNFIKTCDTLYMLGINEAGSVYSFNYQDNIANTPTVNNNGPLFGNIGGMQVMHPYWYNDTLWAISASFSNHPVSNVFRMPIANINGTNSVIKYYDAQTTRTYSQVGVYDVTVHCDQGDNRGPQSFCKEIVVVNPTGINDLAAKNNKLKLYPNPATTELNIVVPEDGKYAYTITNILGQRICSMADINGREGVAQLIDLKPYHLVAGVYFVTLSIDGSDFTSRFVVR